VGTKRLPLTMLASSGMAPTLTRDDVLAVAELAHLELTDAEVELFTRQLADILAYAAEVQRIDTTDISPTSHGRSPRTVWRDDVPGASLDRGQVLERAPDAAPEAGLFRVPKVL
jgi:aspartyl-tRNA(Asn)/glutamyl-tRNA(Gln) amidotransferase subunit C